MTEEKNISLEKMNSFGVIHRAKKLISFENKDEVIRYLKNNKSEIDDILILGEGSNTLFTKDFNGIIFQSNIKGIEIIKEDNDMVKKLIKWVWNIICWPFKKVKDWLWS